MICLLLLLYFLTPSYQNILINGTSFKALYQTYGYLPTQDIISELFLPESFDICDLQYSNLNSSLFQNKIVLVSYSIDNTNSFPFKYCLSNILASKLEELGANGLIFMSINITESNSNYLYPILHKSTSSIPVLQVAEDVGTQLIEYIKNGNNLVVLEKPSDNNINQIKLYRGLYIFHRAFNSFFFFCNLLMSSRILIDVIRSRNRAVGKAPLIILSQVAFVSLGKNISFTNLTARCIWVAVDPHGFQGIFKYYVDNLVNGIALIVLMSACILLLLFWFIFQSLFLIFKRASILSFSHRIKIVSALKVIYIIMNMILVGSFVGFYSFSAHVQLAFIIFTFNYNPFNFIVALIAALSTVAFIIVYWRVARTLRRFSELGTRTKTLEKITRFAFGCVIIVLLIIGTVLLQFFLPINSLIPTLIAWRTLESVMLALLTILFWDKKVQREDMSTVNIKSENTESVDLPNV